MNCRAQNLVELGPLLKVKADAFCQPGGADRTMVDIKEVVFQIGSFEFPVKVCGLLC